MTSKERTEHDCDDVTSELPEWKVLAFHILEAQGRAYRDWIPRWVARLYDDKTDELEYVLKRWLAREYPHQKNNPSPGGPRVDCQGDSSGARGPAQSPAYPTAGEPCTADRASPVKVTQTAEQGPGNSPAVKDAIKKTIDELSAMSPEEFRKKLDEVTEPAPAVTQEEVEEAARRDRAGSTSTGDWSPLSREDLDRCVDLAFIRGFKAGRK